MSNNSYQPKTGVPCGCRPGVQRDNCPQCEGTGMRIDFAAMRARKLSPSPDYAEEIAAFDSSDYDTEAMRIDARHGNFSPDRAEDYRHENIVAAIFSTTTSQRNNAKLFWPLQTAR